MGRSYLSHTHCGSRTSMQRLPGRLLRRGDSPSPQFTRLRTHILLLARPRPFLLVEETHSSCWTTSTRRMCWISFADVCLSMVCHTSDPAPAQTWPLSASTPPMICP